MATEILLNLYCLGAVIAFCVYLALFLSDHETPLSDRTSWFVLLLASLFWPIALPISIRVELLPRWRRQRLSAVAVASRAQGVSEHLEACETLESSEP